MKIADANAAWRHATTTLHSPCRIYTIWALETDSDTETGVEKPIDQRHRLDEEPFDYKVSKDGRVMVTWRGRQVKTLAGNQAEKFLAAVDGLDEAGVQLALAKATGHFKHGNER